MFFYSVYTVFFVLFCALFLLLYIAVSFPIFVKVYQQLPPGGNPIAVNKYRTISLHIIISHVSSVECRNLLYLLFRIRIRMAGLLFVFAHRKPQAIVTY